MQPYGQLYGTTAALEETCIFDTGNKLTFALSVHAAKVALDERTGKYQVIDYLVVHDTGVMLDETIVEGQIIGAVADGVGGTMLSELLYDEQAQLLTGGLADYLVASAAEAPACPPGPRFDAANHQSSGRSRRRRRRDHCGRTGDRERAQPGDFSGGIGIEQDLFGLPLKPETLLGVLERSRARRSSS